jgi:hypothetical protein
MPTPTSTSTVSANPTPMATPNFGGSTRCYVPLMLPVQVHPATTSSTARR